MSVVLTIGKNIKELMRNQSVSQRKLAEVIDVTHPTVGKYLKGEQEISSVKLLELSKFFGVSLDYFFREHEEAMALKVRVDQLSREMELVNLKKIIVKFTDYVDIIDETSVAYVPANYLFQRIRGFEKQVEGEIQGIALLMRAFLDIKHHIPYNYYSVIDSHGIKVISTPLSNSNIISLSAYSEKLGCFIYVNSDNSVSEKEQLFALCKELGHLMLSRSNYHLMDEFELHAGNASYKQDELSSMFARYFLMPKSLVLEYTKEHVGILDLPEMANHFKISFDDLIWVLKRYDLIDEREYNEVCCEEFLGEQRYEFLKPLSYEEKNNRLIESMRVLYQKDKITVSKIGEVLDIGVENSRRLVKSWGDRNGKFKYYRV